MAQIDTYNLVKHSEILQNDVKIHQKSEEMVPRNAPKATLGASWYEVTKTSAT